MPSLKESLKNPKIHTPRPSPPRERSFYRGREQGEGQAVVERTPNYQYLALCVYQLTGDSRRGVLG